MDRNEYMRQYQREWLAARRAIWLERMGNQCVQCGSTDGLEFDHVDRSQKEHYISQIWSRKEEVIEKELAKCQLLCLDCHKVKTRGERFVPHGASRYYNGCRCEVCTQANREHSRTVRANKKLKSQQ